MGSEKKSEDKTKTKTKANIIKTESVCSCGAGDKEKAQKNYFENKCPNCGKEGTLQVNVISNGGSADSSDKKEDSDDSVSDNPVANEIVCSNCKSKYCGQDGYDLDGGSRGGLTPVNPDEVDDDGDEEVSTNEEADKTYMSGWEGLCDLLKPLDGLGMMIQRGDYLIVKKIEMPQTGKLWAYEGINVVNDSVTITDYTPEIYNTFVIKWGETYENELEFVFEKHKQLFGERKTVLEAKKVKAKEDEEDTDKDKDKDKDKNKDKDKDKDSEEGQSWSVTDWLFGSSNNDDVKKTQEQANNIDSSNVGTNGEEQEGNTEEVPITDRDEAIQFGLTEVGKAKRDDGHKVELKVIGNQVWQMGEWCHVKLPSFNEDSYMFISKCSFESSPDNEYINSLTLVDYPPSLGKKSKKTTDENTQEDSINNQDSQNNQADGNTDSTNTGSDTTNNQDNSENSPSNGVNN